jgi:hypothetical protein
MIMWLARPVYKDADTVSRCQQLQFLMYSTYHRLNLSQWPRGLRRGSAASRLLGLRVRILPRAWMSVCCECCVLLGRGLCDGSPTECGVSECDREASSMRRL